jgi:hypothetical protein
LDKIMRVRVNARFAAESGQEHCQMKLTLVRRPTMRQMQRAALSSLEAVTGNSA